MWCNGVQVPLRTAISVEWRLPGDGKVWPRLTTEDEWAAQAPLRPTAILRQLSEEPPKDGRTVSSGRVAQGPQATGHTNLALRGRQGEKVTGSGGFRQTERPRRTALVSRRGCRSVLSSPTSLHHSTPDPTPERGTNSLIHPCRVFETPAIDAIAVAATVACRR